jgi:hypothetical protein
VLAGVDERRGLLRDRSPARPALCEPAQSTRERLDEAGVELRAAAAP